MIRRHPATPDMILCEYCPGGILDLEGIRHVLLDPTICTLSIMQSSIWPKTLRCTDGNTHIGEIKAYLVYWEKAPLGCRHVPLYCCLRKEIALTGFVATNTTLEIVEFWLILFFVRFNQSY